MQKLFFFQIPNHEIYMDVAFFKTQAAAATAAKRQGKKLPHNTSALAVARQQGLRDRRSFIVYILPFRFLPPISWTEVSWGQWDGERFGGTLLFWITAPRRPQDTVASGHVVCGIWGVVVQKHNISHLWPWLNWDLIDLSRNDGQNCFVWFQSPYHTSLIQSAGHPD